MAKRLLTVACVLALGVISASGDVDVGSSFQPASSSGPPTYPSYTIVQYQDLKDLLMQVVSGESVQNPFPLVNPEGEVGPPETVTPDHLKWSITKQFGATWPESWGLVTSDPNLDTDGDPVSELCYVDSPPDTGISNYRCRGLESDDEHLEFVDLIDSNGLLADDSWKPTPWTDDYQDPPEPPRWQIWVGWGPYLTWRGPYRYYIPIREDYTPTPEEQELIDYAEGLKAELEQLPVTWTVEKGGWYTD